MNLNKIATPLVTALSVGLLIATPVAAAPPGQEVREAVKGVRDEVREARAEFREEIKERRQEQRGFLEQLREKIASKAGFLGSLLGRRVVIGSGKLTAINGTTLTIEKDGKSYTVLTGTFANCTTQFRRRFWGSASLAELTVGDMLNVIGRWQDEAKTTIEACIIRDLSIQKYHGVFVGTVLSLTGSGWVMDPVGDRPNQTVTVSASTKFVNRRNEPITQADIAVGHRVRVKGLWNRVNNTLTEVTHVKDYSLPPLPTGGPTPTATPTATPTP